MALGVANGVLREVTYGSLIPEIRAHQLSTVLLIFFTGLFVWLLNNHWPIPSLRRAWMIGLAWLSLTILFEFGFGHFVIGHPWARLFADYNILAGRIWILFLVWILVLPVLIYRYGK